MNFLKILYISCKEARNNIIKFYICFNLKDPLFLANKAEMNNLSFTEYNNRNKIDFYFSIAGYSHFLFIFKEIVKNLDKISFEFSKNSIYFL